ncbi:MAG TPA: alkaline phosphatase family protein [Candidatus Dormibacteraeota bacterium]
MSRVLVVGLDALDPRLVTGWLPELPNLRRLTEAGISGPLRSVVQPVTPAAWTAMVTGRNQGHFGFTDFLYRPSADYRLDLVHSGAVRCQRLWDLAAPARSVAVGVPVGYPPVAIPGGVSLSCFMAPSLDRPIASPPELQAELLAATSRPYLLDVAVEAGERDRDALAAELIELDRQRFDIALHLMRTRAWELLFLVCLGTDRVGHYFMRYQDPAHRRHPGPDRHGETMLRHYRYCDERLGHVLEAAGPDTAVLVVSDHGMQRLDGRVFLNRWLIERGHLRLAEAPPGPLGIRAARVDWAATRAWASGYGGQVHVNVRGREPAGIVPEERVDELCREIAEGLRELRGPEGERLSLETFLGSHLFDGPYAGRCPDLCVQFDDLRWLASDRVDAGPVVEPLAAEGIDDGSHAPLGWFAMAGPGIPAAGRYEAVHLLDVAPTILDLLGAPVPELDGQPVHRAEPAIASPYEEGDAAVLTNRLQKLYLE